MIASGNAEREQQKAWAERLRWPTDGADAEGVNSDAPLFNGALVVGIRPATPFLYTLAVSGTRPTKYAVRNLPSGLRFNASSGIVSGSI